MNADGKRCRLSAFMGVHLRPWLIFSHLAAPSYPSDHLEPVSAKACLGESVLKPACVNRLQKLLDEGKREAPPKGRVPDNPGVGNCCDCLQKPTAQVLRYAS